MASISVVIPTIGRPELALAVRSALEQTVVPLEILVMADTLAPLEFPDHPTVKVIRVGPGAGGNVARQKGIESATSELIALLDDDDEWLPSHLASQLALLPPDANQNLNWIATSRLYARRSDGSSEVWPDRLKSSDETLPQYIFRKHSIFRGVGFIQASTLVFPKALALKIPFDPTLKFHQDVGWLVDLSNHDEEIDVYQSQVPSVVYNIGAQTVSKKITADQSIDWARRLDPSDKRTLGDFIVVHAIQSARYSGSLKDMFTTILIGIRSAAPGFSAVAYGCLLLGRALAGKLTGRRA